MKRTASALQVFGIMLLAAGLGWVFGWWWSLVLLGAGLVMFGVAVELGSTPRRAPQPPAPTPAPWIARPGG